ncbi:C-type lectin domain family 9 member A-like [Hemitrygon akajei]|uniref:C-type lectin domain family 9 member A-like n=1 Tax=Hemitrygon akajei TaxID=2704970 RepID=UPI003BFA1092
MDDSETDMNRKPTKTGSLAPSRDHQTSTYTELNIRKVECLTNTQTDGLDPTYSLLNFRRNEPHNAKNVDPSIASGPGEMSVTAPAAAPERESEVKIGNKPYRLICLLCLVTSALIVTVAGLSIHGMHSDLRHQFAEMETKYRSVNETKAQICELLTSRREQECSQSWIRNEGGCYFITTLKFPYDKARLYCWDSDSKLLDINSAEEENFVVKAVRDQVSSYWIGKCKDGKVASNVLFRMYDGDFECGKCTNDTEVKDCSQVRARFICEKSARFFPDISEKIKYLCQQPVGPT